MRQTDKQANRQRQTGKQTGRQFGRQAERRTGGGEKEQGDRQDSGKRQTFISRCFTVQSMYVRDGWAGWREDYRP